jgi:hypothetical protein
MGLIWTLSCVRFADDTGTSGTGNAGGTDDEKGKQSKTLLMSAKGR